ncbi:MAG: HlyC/CorC family transporter [bacterium]|nr:HlyC/CorC family transporter [bacterium]
MTDFLMYLIPAVVFWFLAMIVVGLISAFYRVSGLHRNGLLEEDSVGRVLNGFLANPRRFQITTGTFFLTLSLLGGFSWGSFLKVALPEASSWLFYLFFVLGILTAWSLGGALSRMLATTLAVSFSKVAGTVLYPVFWLLDPWASLLLAAMDKMGDTIWVGDMQQHLSEGEIRELINSETEESALDGDEREMIQSIFEFHDTAVREIMVPRIDMAALDADAQVSDIVDQVNENGHSRIPVFKGNIDQVIGILYSKDLLKLVKNGGFDSQNMKLSDLVRDAYFIPESKKIDEVLDEFRNQRIHMAVVIDEYGGTAGLVTLEDVIEEIVGEIEDEFDADEELVQWLDDRRVRLDPKLSLDDFEEIVGVDLQDAEGADTSETLAGLVYEAAGKVPADGDQVVVSGYSVTVEGVSGQRITRVLFVSDHTLTGFKKKEEA